MSRFLDRSYKTFEIEGKYVQVWWDGVENRGVVALSRDSVYRRELYMNREDFEKTIDDLEKKKDTNLLKRLENAKLVDTGYRGGA